MKELRFPNLGPRGSNPLGRAIFLKSLCDPVPRGEKLDSIPFSTVCANYIYCWLEVFKITARDIFPVSGLVGRTKATLMIAMYATLEVLWNSDKDLGLVFPCLTYKIVEFYFVPV